MKLFPNFTRHHLITHTYCFCYLTVLNDTANHNLELVQGFPGISNTTVWVTADSVPPNEEVVTTYPLSEAQELRAYVECIKGQSSISFGLIVPEDRYFFDFLFLFPELYVCHIIYEVMSTVQVITTKGQGHPTSIFGKYLL